MKGKDENILLIHISLQLYVIVLNVFKVSFWLKRNKSVFNPHLLCFWFHGEDFDDCSMWGVCDQLCEDRVGSHRCSCREGYVLEQHRYCRAGASSEGHPLCFNRFSYLQCARICIAPFTVCQSLWLLYWASALLSGSLLRTECCFSKSCLCGT